MKLSWILVFGLLFSCGILNAQNDYRNGYIIDYKGDTLHGQIDYRSDFVMGYLCRFKDSNNEIIDFFPDDILAYRFIDSKYFVSRELNGKKVFLEYLIKGKIDIYYLRDDIGNHYYIKKEGEEFIELPYEKGIKYIGDKKVFYESKKHIGLLQYYMKDAPAFYDRINSLKSPEHQSLIKLAEDYHNAVCNDEECIIYEKSLPRIKISISPFVGFIQYKGYNQYVNELGSYIYFQAPRTNENLYYKTGLVFHKLSRKGKVLNVIEIPLQFQYLYSVYRLQPGISAGINVLGIMYKDKINVEHTLCLNANLDYKIYNRLYLTTGFNTEYTPLGNMVLNEGSKFDIISYSFDIGLKIDI